MIIVQRLTQQVRPGKWGELAALDAKFNVVEERLGLPPKRRLRCLVGGDTTDTLVVERQWESMAALGAVFERVLADPEWMALSDEMAAVIASNQDELYALLP